MDKLLFLVGLNLIAGVGLVSGDQPQACVTLGDAAVQGGLNALVAAATAAAPALQADEVGMEVISALSVAEVVPADMRITVFAPTDTAFQTALQTINSATGSSLEPQSIAEVILNHVVPGDLTSATIKTMLGEAGGSAIVQTLVGSDLYVTTVDDGLYVQSRGIEAPGALVVVADTVTCVGPVHVIDAVLLPTDLDGMNVVFDSEVADDEAIGPSEVDNGAIEPSEMDTQACASVGTTAASAGLTSLASTIRAAAEDLKNTPSGLALIAAVSNMNPLVADARVTVFAPTNEAFAAAAEKFGGTLPEAAVANVLLNHAVPGDFTADNITTTLGSSGGSMVVRTLLQNDLLITTTDDGIAVQSRGLEAPGALVTAPEVMTCLGPVHSINAVLLPAFPDGSQDDFEAERADMPDVVMDDVAGTDGLDMGVDGAVPGADEGLSGARETVQVETDGAVASAWSIVFGVLAAAFVAML